MAILIPCCQFLICHALRPIDHRHPAIDKEERFEIALFGSRVCAGYGIQKTLKGTWSLPHVAVGTPQQVVCLHPFIWSAGRSISPAPTVGCRSGKLCRIYSVLLGTEVAGGEDLPVRNLEIMIPKS